ncbi:MAG: M3 family oligoendopeptidase [Gemmataceae bacterium]|nr:M3 family oligoendopeptidase [Gemmataceae bacterium]
MAVDSKPSTARGVAWDLGDLYAGPDDPRLDADLAAALKRAEAFEAAYRGKAAQHLAAAVAELESLGEQMDKPAIYASLLHAALTTDPRHGALVAKTREKRTAINKHLIFFDLEWVALDDATATRLMADPAVARWRHWLGKKRVFKPHFLTEPEEKILDEKSITGKAAFVRLFDETVSALEFDLDGKKNLQQVLSGLYSPDRSHRQAAAASLTAGLKSHSRLLSYILNTLVQDHKSDCELRRYPSAMSPRNMDNEIEPAVVDALMQAAEQHFPTVQRYYRLKAKLLGLDRLADYDRYAPISGETPEVDWPTARRLVAESYDQFSKEAGAIVRDFFDKRWIDADPRDGKRGGAFSASGVPSGHPYILMSYQDRMRDVMTLAHELGHGVHQWLSRGVGYLECDTPLTTAETASVFGEMLTFKRLQQAYPDPKARLALLCGKIEDGFATVFRQVVLTRFEQSVHAARRDEGELSPDRIDELWMAANAPMHGDTVELTPGYACWWSYIGHFVHSPFYCYAYAFGELLVLALVKRYEQEGAAFVPKYLAMLSAGGSKPPHELVAALGVDVTDPAFWGLGLSLLDDMVAEAERLAGGAR